MTMTRSVLSAALFWRSTAKVLLATIVVTALLVENKCGAARMTATTTFASIARKPFERSAWRVASDNANLSTSSPQQPLAQKTQTHHPSPRSTNKNPITSHRPALFPTARSSDTPPNDFGYEISISVLCVFASAAGATYGRCWAAGSFRNKPRAPRAARLLLRACWELRQDAAVDKIRRILSFYVGSLALGTGPGRVCWRAGGGL